MRCSWRVAWSKATTAWVTWSVAGSALAATRYALAQQFGLDPIWDSLLDARVFSTIGQPNPLAAVLGFACLLSLGLKAGWASTATTLTLLGGVALTKQQTATVDVSAKSSPTRCSATCKA